jgi:tetraacyldisaccharide 4'-kinase
MSHSRENLVQNIWYGESSLSWFLLPLTWIYTALVVCRKYLYTAGLISSQTMPVPVIIVGNMTVGGTGKTPLAIWLVTQLKEKGFQPGIISRGYRGKVGSIPVKASADSDPDIVGDEAVLMARRGKCPVVVHPDRVAAAQTIIELGVDVIVADDGLQHFRLARDFEIVVIDGTRGFGNGKLLPAGPLREPTSRLQTVDAVLVQQYSDDYAKFLRRAADWHPSKFDLQASSLSTLDDAKVMQIEMFAGRTVHAVAGIGNPERFFRLLESHDIEVIRHPLPDHADILQTDITFDDDLDVVMTEKDAVKCLSWLDTSHCWYVPVDVNFRDSAGEALLDSLLQKISRRKYKRS